MKPSAMTLSKPTGLRVKHARYLAARQILLERISIALAANRTKIIPLLGPSGCGKTELLRDVIASENVLLKPDGELFETSTWVMAVVPPRPNERSLYAAMLQACGVRHKGKSEDMRQTLINQIRKDGVKVIALDECGHCAERGSNLSKRAVGDHLKTIVDATGVVLVLAGISRFADVTRENEQFRARSLRPVELHPYAWSADEDRGGFVDSVVSLLNRLGDRGVEVGVAYEEVVLPLYLVSGGRIGTVVDLLAAAVQTDPSRQLTLENLGATASHFGDQAFEVDFLSASLIREESLHAAYARIMLADGLSVDAHTSHLAALLPT